MMKTKTQLPSGLHTLLWKEGKFYVAKCVEVEVASQGLTRKAALTNIAEALSLYFEEEKTPKSSAYKHIELLPIQPLYA